MNIEDDEEFAETMENSCFKLSQKILLFITSGGLFAFTGFHKVCRKYGLLVMDFANQCALIFNT